MDTQSIKIARMEEKLDRISSDISEIKDGVKERAASEEHKFDKLDRKYSSKWVEKAVFSLSVLSIGAVIKIIFHNGV